jgi:hypothetical protein
VDLDFFLQPFRRDTSSNLVGPRGTRNNRGRPLTLSCSDEDLVLGQGPAIDSVVQSEWGCSVVQNSVQISSVRLFYEDETSCCPSLRWSPEK